MNLDPYIEQLRRQLLVAAETGGDETRALAERLIAPLDAASRLVLLEALSTAAGEITLDLMPGSVEVRLRGRDPEFTVTPPPSLPPEEEMGTEAPAIGAASSEDAGDGGTARITLRLTEQTKARIEEAAGREGLSVNAWLGRVVAAALEPKERQSHSGRGPPVGRRFTGWVR